MGEGVRAIMERYNTRSGLGKTRGVQYKRYKKYAGANFTSDPIPFLIGIDLILWCNQNVSCIGHLQKW